MTTYDPRAHGALCDSCSLKDRVVVPPEIRPGKPLVVRQEPGSEEEDQLRPSVGPSSRELERALDDAGKSRSDVSLTNTVLCRSPGRGLRHHVRQLQHKNATRKRAGQPPLPTPVECCKSRLLAEVDAAPAVLLMGKFAYEAVAGDRVGDKGLWAVRGYPITVRGKPTVATLEPAFVMRKRRWTETFRADVGKAFRHGEGRLRWVEPVSVLDPTVDRLDYALERLAAAKAAGGRVCVDIETDGKDPNHCRVRCVGLGVAPGVLGEAGRGVCVGFLSVETPRWNFRCQPEVGRERLRNFFTRSDVNFVGQNINLFDRPILEREGMPLPDYDRVRDLVVEHHVVDSELRHDLATLSSRYTDAPSHKDVDHDKWDNDCNMERHRAGHVSLHYYCTTDTIVTAAVECIVALQVTKYGQQDAYRSDVRFQKFCVGLHRAGMLIDESERRRHAARLWIKLRDAERRALDAAGKKMNVGSPDQVRDFLFDEWDIQVTDYETDTGEPSVGKDAVFEILTRSISGRQETFLDALLEFREAQRSLTKDVLKRGEVPVELEGYAERKGKRRGRGTDKKLVVDPTKSGMIVDPATGRTHPYWSCHSVVTGRLSSSNPNCQNVPDTRADPDSLRSMYVAAPGNVLVACDLEQVELRLVALLCGSKLWLDSFKQGLDVHRVNASTFFDEPYESITKKGFKRRYSKGITFMFLYGGEAHIAMTNMRRVKDPETGIRPYARMTLREAETMRDKLLEAHPLKPWWDRSLSEYRRDGWLKDLVLGRMRRFLDAGDGGAHDDEVLNEIRNFRVQASVGSYMGGSGASGTVADSIGWYWEPGTLRGLDGVGPIHHGHDALMVEVAESQAGRAATLLQDAMCGSLTYEGRTIDIPTEAKIGRRWSEV